MSVSVQRYNFTLAGNGTFLLPCVGSQFIILASSGALGIRLDVGGEFRGLEAGQGYKGKSFTGLQLTDESGAVNTGYILVSDDDYLDKRVTLASAVTLAPQTLAPEPTAIFTSAAAVVANTAEVILAAGANVQGVMVCSATIGGSDKVQLAASRKGQFVAHTAAPTTIYQGWIFLRGSNTQDVGHTLPAPLRLPPGYGIYFIEDNSYAVNLITRSLAYRVL